MTVDIASLMEGDTKQIGFEIRAYEEVIQEAKKGNLSKQRGEEAKIQLQKLIPLHEARVKITN